MRPPSEKQVVRQVPGILAELLGAGADNVPQQHPAELPDADLVIRAAGRRFVVEYKVSGAAGAVASAAEQVRAYATKLGPKAIPLVVVPYMGEVGRERCERAGVQWFDLSGNAHIVAPGLRILIEGRPNRFKRRGRPSTAFAPKASRIARWLLIHEGQFLTQREIVQGTGIDEGHASRVVARLEEDRLIERDTEGAIRAARPDLLLDAWREVYDFNKHSIIRGHIAARSGEVLLRQLGQTLRKHEVDHAATGLGAAWLLTRFAGFRLVTLYLHEPLAPALMEEIGFREEPRGANAWLVVPNDEGVFQGGTSQDGVWCAHPTQVYLDLWAHPERASDAASELRSRVLTWRSDG